MSTKTRGKTPDPIIPDAAVEERMAEYIKNPPTSVKTEALAVKEDFRVEQIRKSNGEGERLAIRASSGKFVKRQTAIAMKDAKESSAFLTAPDPDDPEGPSRKHKIREALYKAALHPTEKSLGSCVKVAEFFENESGNTLAKERMMQDDSVLQNTVRVVLIQAPQLMYPEIHDPSKDKPKPTQPSWVDAEVVSTNPPTS